MSTPPKFRTAEGVDALKYTATVIGDDLRRMRLEAGLSQSDVARKARMRPEMISRLENGKGNPTVRLVERVVRAIEGLRA